MSSVLIRGMKMPKGCLECQFKDIGMSSMTQCLLVAGWVKYANDGYGIPDACPLVELPEKHGDLIDRQKLLEDNKHLEYPTDSKYRRDRAWAVGFNTGARHCNEHAVYAKTIIEAEGNEG